jgi:HD-GYP domain-containing protein (c-di-GMP phosphodiesterase class II)
MYFTAPMQVDQQVRRFILHGRNILAVSATDLSADNPDLQAMLEASAGPLLKALDAVTNRYANENRAEIGGLRTAESLILGVLLTTLLLEALFIFRPLEREVGRHTTELVRAYDETIEGWSRALDLRDHETEGHSVRVTEMTLRLARLTGMSEQDLVQVRRGALLHDIGKVGIPDAILLKPGPLDESEWTVMRRHPGFAGDLLSPIEFLQPALSIPLSHHERWDGTGYPAGLTGEAIPFSARLFAVVDIWDALRSERPYRKAWNTDRVRSHVKDLCGTHLDPAVVKLFLDNEAQILAGLYEDT